MMMFYPIADRVKPVEVVSPYVAIVPCDVGIPQDGRIGDTDMYFLFMDMKNCYYVYVVKDQGELDCNGK